MARMEFKCPECKKVNRIVIIGDDSGKFTRACVNCDSDLEIELTEQGKELQAILISDKININETKVVPKDYKQYEGKVPETSKKNRMVMIISLLILSSAFMGFVNGIFLLKMSSQEYGSSEEVKIEIVVKNSTTYIKNTIIFVNSEESTRTFWSFTGIYEIFLKPGKYEIEIKAPLHRDLTKEIFIPPQKNNVTFRGEGVESMNVFTFNMQEGVGNINVEDNVFILIFRWAPVLMLSFAVIGTWGAWVTHNLQSYKNAQIGGFFAILSGVFTIIGPILGIIALVLLPKIKNMFNRSF